jgi:phosphomannomutase
VIDSNGIEINRNKLIAVLSAIVLAEHPGSTIVTDSVTSDGLEQFITQKGGQHLRYMRGYKNVIDKGKELNESGTDCFLMIETSGHGAMKENHNLDDGAYLAVKIVIEAVRRRKSGGKGVADLLSDLKEPKEEAEARLKILSDDFKPVGASLIESLKTEVLKGDQSMFKNASSVEVNHEGYRVCIDEGENKAGWFLLRQSLHDPVCVLNFESDTKGGVKRMAKEFITWFDGLGVEGVDVEAVRKVAK